MNTLELSPSVKHVIAMDPKQLAEDLPFYDGRYGREILEEALPHVAGRAAGLIRAQIEALKKEQATKNAQNPKD